MQGFPPLQNAASSLQELDIRNLQQEIRARDDDVDRMQQQWNLQNFKYQLLIDMWAMRVRFTPFLLRLYQFASLLQTSCCSIVPATLPCASAMQVLDNEQLASNAGT